MRTLFFALLIGSAFAVDGPTAFHPRPYGYLPEPVKKEPKIPEPAKAEHQEEESEAVDKLALQPLPINLSYVDPKGAPVPISMLTDEVPIPFTKSADGYHGPKKGEKITYLTVKQLNQLPQATVLYASALRSVSERLSSFIYKKKGYLGVFCTTSGEEISKVLYQKNSNEGCPGLTFKLELARCGNIRTAEGESINSVRTAFIRRNSPVKDGALLRRKELSDYALYLSRYPDRRVDIQFHPLEAMGQVGIDYVVKSERPWHFYTGISNTGTPAIGEWIENFAFVFNQAIIRDAQFKIEYATAGFNGYHTMRTSYEVPFFKVPRTRFQAHFSYMRYSSTQIGFENSDFSGRQTAGGGIFKTNLHQNGSLFLDGEIGLTYRAVCIINKPLNVDSNYVRFFLPRAALNLEARKRAWSVGGSLAANTTIGGAMVGSQSTTINLLGRSNVSRKWIYLDSSFSTSLFVDSLHKPEAGPLAHEVRLIGAAQWTPSTYRLIAQLKGVIGGLYSVRGYPESFISGDSTWVASAEYVVHIPRLFPSRKPAKLFNKPFYITAPKPGMLPSWDFAVRGFVDSGGAYSNRHSNERDATLLSTGIGFDLNFLNHFIMRSDVGVALKKSVGTSVVDAGHMRASVSATVIY